MPPWVLPWSFLTTSNCFADTSPIPAPDSKPHYLVVDIEIVNLVKLTLYRAIATGKPQQDGNRKKLRSTLQEANIQKWFYDVQNALYNLYGIRLNKASRLSRGNLNTGFLSSLGKAVKEQEMAFSRHRREAFISAPHYRTVKKTFLSTWRRCCTPRSFALFAEKCGGMQGPSLSQKRNFPTIEPTLSGSHKLRA
ncbi:hypothetical protein M378DRAFT_25079 [Amanita muscaria Koide BX008]|uniref:Uncharacterized protein n=1 Tax=Amanita muscaria (strain Koide BX008) TaxID=946122 RepID=A0A0C2SJU8_AMAMK|nr:hypothetical protein M378DRAFT_25079 [Amanita muscaria Koide BX008]